MVFLACATQVSMVSWLQMIIERHGTTFLKALLKFSFLVSSLVHTDNAKLLENFVGH